MSSRPLSLPDPDQLSSARAARSRGGWSDTRSNTGRERVPYRRSGRPEIEELTAQRRVPVLIDGDEVIHDSKRIPEYLEWSRAGRPHPAIQSEAWKHLNQRSRSPTPPPASSRSCSPARRTPSRSLRVAVRGGGCSGFQYALALDKRKDDDHVFEHNGVSVVVDKVSMQFVFGSEVDYVEGLQGAGFAVNNPNVVAACGCGSSFQVREDAEEPAAVSA